jgi:hypothetical protein
MHNALPPGTSQRTASQALARATEDSVNAGIARQTAPLPPGTKAQATVSVPVTSKRSVSA